MTNANATSAPVGTDPMDQRSEPKLKRVLPLSLVVLYGLGVTIGAGIYVLIGATAERAGIHAPVAFAIAACVMGLTAASYSELGGRLPVSAGEAAYVRVGLSSKLAGLIVGLLVVMVGIVSDATIAIGSAGYISAFVDLPHYVILPIIVIAMGVIAAWGIMESVTLAATLTLVEIGGLLLVILGTGWSEPQIVLRAGEVIPATFDTMVWTGLFSASLLAFFAFIGFEDIANIAEEVKDPQRNLPRAIFLTLAIATVLYILVVAIAVLTVPRQELVQSNAPLALVFERATGALLSFSPQLRSLQL